MLKRRVRSQFHIFVVLYKQKLYWIFKGRLERRSNPLWDDDFNLHYSALNHFLASL